MAHGESLFPENRADKLIGTLSSGNIKNGKYSCVAKIGNKIFSSWYVNIRKYS